MERFLLTLTLQGTCRSLYPLSQNQPSKLISGEHLIRYNTTRNVQLLMRIKISTRLVKLEAQQCQLVTEFSMIHTLFFL